MTETTQPDPPSHYDRIGGIDTVRTAVDLFYDRVLADPDLAGYFEGVDVDRVKGHQALLISSLLGGPEEYTGRALGVAHQGLGITDEHYDKVVTHLVGVLEGAGVPDDTVDAVKGAVTAVKPDIVDAPAAV